MKKIFLYFSLFFISFIQAQQCALLDAGDDKTVNCTDNCTTREAHLLGGFVDYGNFTGYTITDETPCPLPQVTSGTPSGITMDDYWSDVINLPFTEQSQNLWSLDKKLDICYQNITDAYYRFITHCQITIT